jgi:hypothetical protein
MPLPVEKELKLYILIVIKVSKRIEKARGVTTEFEDLIRVLLDRRFRDWGTLCLD